MGQEANFLWRGIVVVNSVPPLSQFLWFDQYFLVIIFYDPITILATIDDRYFPEDRPSLFQ